MTIDQAIAVLELRVASPFVKANPDSLAATSLGIEALKRMKLHRRTWMLLDNELLPGETEE